MPNGLDDKDKASLKAQRKTAVHRNTVLLCPAPNIAGALSDAFV